MRNVEVSATSEMNCKSSTNRLAKMAVYGYLSRTRDQSIFVPSGLRINENRSNIRISQIWSKPQEASPFLRVLSSPNRDHRKAASRQRSRAQPQPQDAKTSAKRGPDDPHQLLKPSALRSGHCEIAIGCSHSFLTPRVTLVAAFQIPKSQCPP